MAHTKKIQFYRNNTVLRPDTQNEKTALTVAKEAFEDISDAVDGEIILTRYQEGNDDPVKTLAGLYHLNNNVGSWTYLVEINIDDYYTKEEIHENEELIAQALSDLDSRVNNCLPSSTVIPKGVFKVTVSENNSTYTTDKTSSQIYQAYQDGYVVFCEYSGIILSPLTVSQASVVFFTTYQLAYVHIEILNSTVTFGTGSFLTNVKTLNGNNMAGSGSVTLTASDVGAASRVTEVTVTSSGSVSQTLLPNKFYNFTGSLTSLTLTLTAGNGTELDVYAGKFIADSSGCPVTLPQTVTVADSAPAIEGGNTYEFNIVDNVLIYIKV